MPAHDRVLYYDPSTQETFDSKTITDSSKFQSREFQSLDIPRLCNTITVYVDWKETANARYDTAKESPGLPMALGPRKFALSRSRRMVNDTDLVAKISLKKHKNNSWLQRHLPLQPSLFSRIVIGPISNSITAMKDEKTEESTRERATRRFWAIWGAVEDIITPMRDKNREVEDQSTTSHVTSVECC
ncbi:hypothetical protein F5Y10DRAFT_283639 [Nemania abortiva]|nr:hypothetical protein F5Y10DRAFT_283639 [Nemania abortiva]